MPIITGTNPESSEEREHGNKERKRIEGRKSRRKEVEI
jgi:hypothetical protein